MIAYFWIDYLVFLQLTHCYKCIMYKLFLGSSYIATVKCRIILWTWSVGITFVISSNFISTVVFPKNNTYYLYEFKKTDVIFVTYETRIKSGVESIQNMVCYLPSIPIKKIKYVLKNTHRWYLYINERNSGLKKPKSEIVQ